MNQPEATIVAVIALAAVLSFWGLVLAALIKYVWGK